MRIVLAVQVVVRRLVVLIDSVFEFSIPKYKDSMFDVLVQQIIF